MAKKLRDFLGTLHQNRPVRGLTERALDLLMSGVADQDHGVTAGGEPAGLNMCPGHQRACRVDHFQPPVGGLGPHRRGHPWAENTTVAPCGTASSSSTNTAPRACSAATTGSDFLRLRRSEYTGFPVTAGSPQMPSRSSTC